MSNKQSISTFLGIAAAVVLGTITPVRADITQYTNRTDFEDALGAFLVDGYDAKGYAHGDVFDGPVVDIHTNAQMSGILGETDYITTGFDNLNLIVASELGFTTTSFGSSDGVFGVGFDVMVNIDPLSLPTIPYT